MQGPMIVIGGDMERFKGRKAQLHNIQAAKTIAGIIRTCLGPRAMLKMLLNPLGGIVMTNDGNVVLREIEVANPAAKSMIELSRIQDEVGDGTTTVIVFISAAFIEQPLHPLVIISAYKFALENALQIANDVSIEVDVSSPEEVKRVIKATVGTKFIPSTSDFICDIAYKAVKTVMVESNDKRVIDIKRYVRTEKIPGGSIEDSCVLNGVMINKDITHPKMRRYIEKPRIILLDSTLEYRKGESQTNVEITDESDWARLLQIEEECVEEMCNQIIALKPDVVVTEKGISDLAQHFLVKAGITAIRRVKKTDNQRLSRVTGAGIVNRVEHLSEADVGTKCGLFEIKKIGDEYFSYFVECETPKACTIVVRGASKDIIDEVERSIHEAMCAARNVFCEPYLCPGGGALEMALSVRLNKISKTVEGALQDPFRAIATSFEVIPRTLIENCGGKPIKTLTHLRAKHADPENFTWGIDGITGEIADMRKHGIWDPLTVKSQTIKTAIETACQLLRVDDILSGGPKQNSERGKNTSDACE